MGKLTVAKIRTLTVPGMYRDEGTPTLFFKVWPGGSRSWVQRVHIDGKPRCLGLGGYPLVSLDEARDHAYQTRKAARAGGDPVAAKREGRGPTFADALEKVLALHGPTWRDGGKTEKIWRASLAQHVLPRIGTKPVRDVTGSDVLNILAPIWSSRHETARKTKRRIGAVMKWAVAQGLRADDPTLTLTAVLPKPDTLKAQPFKAVHHSQVKATLDTIKATNASFATILAFEFLTLTATRSGETRFAQWSEINLKEKVWTLPKERTKTAVEFRVPLSSRCVEILKEARDRFGDQGLIFPASRGGALSDATLSKLSKENETGTTPHGMRSALRSWCADVNVPREVAESCLAHAVRGIEKSYQRSDLLERRRAVLERWSDYLTGQAPAKVVALRA